MSEKLVKLIKLLSILHLAIFLPKIIYKNDTPVSKEFMSQKKVFSSVKNLIQNHKKFDFVKRANLGVVIDPRFDFKAHIFNDLSLLRNNDFKFTKLLVPKSARKAKFLNISSKIPKTCELFFLDDKTKLIPNLFIDDVDIVMFNMKTVGITYDLCFKMLFKLMSCLVTKDKRILILDKPNPIGRFVEGTGRIPLYHGLSVGELAKYMNKYMFGDKIKLTVIPMMNFEKGMVPSNEWNFCSKYVVLKTLKKLNPINLNVPKRLSYTSILLRKKKGLSAWETDYLNKLCNKIGFYCSNYSYRDRVKGDIYSGVKVLSRKDINNFSSFNTTLTLLRFFYNRKMIPVTFSKSFNKFFGASDLQMFLKNMITLNQLRSRTEKSINSFCSKAKSCLIYNRDLETRKIGILKA